MPITIHLPSRLQTITQQHSPLTIPDASNLQDALVQLTDFCPEIKNSLYDSKSRLNAYIRLSVDGVIVSDFETSLTSDSEIVIVAAVAGG